MKLLSILPPDRYQPGVFLVLDSAGGIILPPVRCRGEADNAAAASAGNPDEDPTKPYGDHPSGLYLVTEVVEVRGQDKDRYGPFFLRLDPVDGEALRAKEAGRTGLGIHGGRPGAPGPNALRATHGCLRVSNAVIAVVATHVRGHLLGGRKVLYEALLVDEEA